MSRLPALLQGRYRDFARALNPVLSPFTLVARSGFSTMNARSSLRTLSWSLCLAVAALTNTACAAGKSVALPDAKLDTPLAAGKDQVAVLAGGCFWGVEAVFEHTKGVKRVESGYAGGNAADADYEKVSRGATTHAEVVRIVYDPAQISYGRLLKIFFSVAHDPTQLNRQGPDIGTQYRSEIFATTAQQTEIAKAYIAQLDAVKPFPSKIVTQVGPLKAFYRAEDYHQDYARLNPNQPYIVYHDAPKVAALQKMFPAQYRPWNAANR
jgi:peptide-methionine (S)-S-oxide reductase